MSAEGEEETEWAYVPDGGVYQVPYRSLYARGFDRMLVAGRCFSADHSAHASCRSMAQTMSMGQAAGVAAPCRWNRIARSARLKPPRYKIASDRLER